MGRSWASYPHGHDNRRASRSYCQAQQPISNKTIAAAYFPISVKLPCHISDGQLPAHHSNRGRYVAQPDPTAADTPTATQTAASFPKKVPKTRGAGRTAQSLCVLGCVRWTSSPLPCPVSAARSVRFWVVALHPWHSVCMRVRRDAHSCESGLIHEFSVFWESLQSCSHNVNGVIEKRAMKVKRVDCACRQVARRLLHATCYTIAVWQWTRGESRVH